MRGVEADAGMCQVGSSEGFGKVVSSVIASVVGSA